MMSDDKTLIPFVRETGFEYWNRYAAINDEFIPIHMYDSAGQEAGYPTAFGMGNLTWAYMHLALHDWFGDAARIEKLSTQFRNAVVRGTTITIVGEIVESTPDETGVRYVVKVTAQNQEGASLAPGNATIFVESFRTGTL